jgi:RNA polymerase sigma-70 factor, ECF subfamily
MTKLSVAELRTSTVAQLVQATQSGQREAFGELFERFERQVFTIALRRIGDYGEAQEVCQDVFVQALQKIAQLREPERFGGWLRSIANRMAINRVVRRRPEVAAEPEALASACVDERTPLTASGRTSRNRNCEPAWPGCARWTVRRWWRSTFRASRCWR